MKTIEIEIPDGHRAEWVNGVLTLVDDKPIEYKFKVGDKVELSIPPYGIHEIKGIAEGVPTPHYKLSDEGNQYYQEDVLTVAQDITDRIKTFEDAYEWCNARGNRLTLEYERIKSRIGALSPDLLAYLKLRIITCALNEGWEPTFTEDERRYYCICNTNGEVLQAVSAIKIGNATPWTLYFKSQKLAEYAASQFADIYADFCGCKKGGEQ